MLVLAIVVGFSTFLEVNHVRRGRNSISLGISFGSGELIVGPFNGGVANEIAQIDISSERQSYN